MAVVSAQVGELTPESYEELPVCSPEDRVEWWLSDNDGMMQFETVDSQDVSRTALTIDINENASEEEESWSLASLPTPKLAGWELRTRPNSIETLTFAHMVDLLFKNKPFACILTYVESQALFYVAPKHRMHLYDSLFNNLQMIGSQLETEGVRLESFTPGTPCLTRYSLDGFFYRATVLANGWDSVMVKFIDYGNQAMVPIPELFPLPESVAALPSMALECALNGVDSRDLVHKLVYLFGREFREGKEVKIHPIRPVSLSKEDENRWFVEIYDRKHNVTELYNTMASPSTARALSRTPREPEEEEEEDDATICDSDTVVEV